jgi:hypothetical protein
VSDPETCTHGVVFDEAEAPTESQFPAVLSYAEWKPGDEVRIGKCMDCGQEIWEAVASLDDARTKRFCNEACERSFASDLGVELG